ncbi:MAG TPA: hypothetical protein VIG24_11040 [Acidimicrobiia bacterium]
MVTFRDFEGKHTGETVWVLGSGKTLDFVDRTFFDGKVVVATNNSWRGKADHAYVCSNHWNVDAPGWMVVPEVEQVPAQDAHGVRPDGPNVLLVPTIAQQYADFTPGRDWPEHGRFVVGPTSLHLSMHWAVWMGAAHIVLVGADCGVIDGENNRVGYYAPVNNGQLEQHAHHRLWEAKLTEMASKIRSMGVSVHSLNPWTTFGLEGHTWEQRR